MTILSLPIKYKTVFIILQENSLKEWSFKKAITVQTYTYLHPVPVPLNIISCIVMGVVCLCKKRIGRCPCAPECRGFLTPADDQPRVIVISNPFQTLRVFLFSLFSISEVVSTERITTKNFHVWCFKSLNIFNHTVYHRLQSIRCGRLLVIQAVYVQGS